jgi:pimeloyl-ACP methyl ester carboxylesterase
MQPDNFSGSAPAVILIHGYGGSESDNQAQAEYLADDGYIVMRYTTRGFHDSDGMINFAGPDDMADFSAVIDFMLANYPVDPSAIGAGGISYGSMISSLGAAHDGRVKAIAAMSGSMDALESLYSNNTNLGLFATGLEVIGYTNGTPDPYIMELLYAMRFNNLNYMPEIKDWADARSPINFVDQLNANGTAVYIMKEWDDYLFKPNRALDMFALLDVPKHMKISPGTHGSSTVFSNIPWDTAYKWFDLHLKGEVNELSGAPTFNIEVEGTGERESYHSYPLVTNEEIYYLHPRNSFDAGNLKAEKYSRSWWQERFFGPIKTNTINSATPSIFTTGIPGLGVLGGVELGPLDIYLIPTTNVILSSPANSIYFDTGAINETMEIRGVPSISLNINPYSNNVQVVGYLYDVGPFGTAKMITHGVRTLLNIEWGKTISMDFDFVATAYDIPAGHKLAVAFDTQDNLQYLRPEYSARNLDFEFSTDMQSSLIIPTLP